VTVIATDERRDLAVVQIAGFNLPVLELANSDAVTVGEPLVVVGSPKGLEGTVTAGILSSVRDSGAGFKVLQTDAAVNPGNSGGPLVNGKAQAIGVVSFKLRSAEGLNFAIPINYVRGLLNAVHIPITLEQMRSALLQSSPAGPSQSSSGPSFTETLGWLKQSIPLGVIHVSYSFPDDIGDRTTKMRVWNLDSCMATIGFEGKTVWQKNPYRINTDARYTLALANISAGSVKKQDTLVRGKERFLDVTGDEWQYVVTLASGSKAIILVSVHNSEPAMTEAVDALPLYFADESLAQRVLAAFLHAAELCRNKEPF